MLKINKTNFVDCPNLAGATLQVGQKFAEIKEVKNIQGQHVE
jgi:hypothetical protein